MTQAALKNSLTVAVTGASGLVGGHLIQALREAGHQPMALRRGDGENSWNVATGAIRTPRKMDVLVHLAGRSIAARWKKTVRKEIWDSRVPATEKLSAFLAGLDPSRRPELFISTSATGIYGDRGDELLAEQTAIAPPGASFLSDVCRGWEAATRAAEDAGIRVIHARLGVVLSGDGGALKAMARAVKFGIGGRIGTGRQWMPWIALPDLTRLFLRLIEGKTESGIINAVAPNPVRQRDFIRALGQVLHRPTVLPLPTFAVKLLLGQMGKEVLLGSQRTVAERFPVGFHLEHESLESALCAELSSR